MSARRDVPLFFWNVLSTELGTAKSYWPPHYDPELLEPDSRAAQVVERVQPELAAGKIVALVEVDAVRILPSLLPMLDEYNYGVMHQMYGRRFNGYMGVLLAWPRSEYSLLEAKQSHMGDVIYDQYKDRLPKKETPAGTPWYLGGAVTDAVSSGVKWALGVKPPKAPRNVYAECVRRQNWVVMARLAARSGNAAPFVVAAYHMPCMFYLPPAMVLHADAVMTEVCKFAGEDPTIVAGDWNFGPASHPYQLITGGSAPMAEPAPFATGEGMRPAADTTPLQSGGPPGWEPTLPKQFLSAAVEAHGQEPAATNQAKMKDMAEFCGVLDFVFLSTGTRWKVAMEAVPGDDQAGRLAPNEDLVSDHVPLDMSLRF